MEEYTTFVFGGGLSASSCLVAPQIGSLGWSVACEEGAWHPTFPPTPPTKSTHPSERVLAERAPTQKLTAAAAPVTESPSKHRVQDSPTPGPRDALDATAMASQLAPELKGVLRATTRDIVLEVVEKAMASGIKTWIERAVDQANKREHEARENVMQHEATDYQWTASG